MHTVFAFRMSDMQKTKSQKAAEFWERMDSLIGEERPYSWAENRGINKSAFQSSRNRRSKPLSKTVELWAQQIGCSFEWLDKGVGEPFKDVIPTTQHEAPKEENTSVEPLIIEEEGLKITTAIDKVMLQTALETTEKKLIEQHLIMQPQHKAEFIVMLYEILIDQEKQLYNKQLLNDVIQEVEECLERLKKSMLPDKKTLLIIAIYTLYSVNSHDKDGIRQTVTDIIRKAA